MPFLVHTGRKTKSEIFRDLINFKGSRVKRTCRDRRNFEWFCCGEQHRSICMKNQRDLIENGTRRLRRTRGMLTALMDSRSKTPHVGVPPWRSPSATFSAKKNHFRDPAISSRILGRTNTRMPYGKLHVLPLSLFILIPVTFLITYTISVQWDHVVPGFPYISETGTLSPESCIFAQFLNIAALLLACCVYIRHRQVCQWQFERGNDLVSKRIVVLTAWCGVLSCFGLDILANFQEARVVAAHMIGAMTCFTAGTIYFCLQTYLSRKMVPAVNGRIVVYIRAALSVLTLILTITTILAGYISMLEFQGNDYKKWLPTDGGWGWHVASTISEWLLAIVYCVFLLTFVPEFRLINFEDPVVTLIYLDKDQDTKLSRKLSPQVQEC